MKFYFKPWHYIQFSWIDLFISFGEARFVSLSWVRPFYLSRLHPEKQPFTFVNTPDGGAEVRW